MGQACPSAYQYIISCQRKLKMATKINQDAESVIKTRLLGDTTAEEGILSALLADPDADIPCGLSPEMFCLEKNRWIYEQAQWLNAHEKPIDYITIRNRLELAQKLDAVGGQAYLDYLLSGVFRTKNIQAYADLVIVEYFKWRVQEIAGRMVGYANDGVEKQPGDMLQELEKELEQLRDLQPGPLNGTPATWLEMRQTIAPTEWLWKPWLAKGFLTLLASKSGDGKSTVLLDLVKSVTTGAPLPDGATYTGERGLVLWSESEAAQALNTERAEKWGLPMGMIVAPFPDGFTDIRLDDPLHRQVIAKRAHEDDIKLIIVDSLSGAHSQQENDSSLRGIMKWLAELARDTRKPLMASHHIRKKSQFEGDEITLDRLRGTTAIVQFARVIWGIDSPNKAHPELRRLQVIKNNLAAFPDPIGFEIQDDGLKFGEAPEAPHVETNEDRARDFLLHLLQREPLPADKIKRELEGAGISYPAANRAKKKLGIVSIKPGGIWYWSLPEKEEDSTSK